MANLPESASFDAGVYQIETTDAVIGGVNGISNLQAKALANRTTWLKQQVDALNALKGMGIQAFSAGSSYVGGQQAIYQKNIWQANTAISPGAFNPANWTRQLGVAAESALADAAPLMSGAAAVGVSTDVAREDHIHPSDTSRAPLASPVFTGNPTGPTPAQFDNDLSLSTTQFVQRALGNFSGWSSFIASGAAIPVSACGRIVQVNLATSGFIYLPLSAQCPAGAALTIINTSNTTTCSIVVQQPDVISLAPIVIKPGESVTLIASPDVNVWFVHAGGGALGNTAGFAATLGASAASQQLPGLSIKVGSLNNGSTATTIPLTFPVAFPNQCVALVLTGLSTAGNVYTHTGRNKIGADLIRGANSSYQLDWIAIGY